MHIGTSTGWPCFNKTWILFTKTNSIMLLEQEHYMVSEVGTKQKLSHQSGEVLEKIQTVFQSN